MNETNRGANAQESKDDLVFINQKNLKKPVDNSKKKWCGDHMTGYAKKNPCKACVFRKPLNSLLGSFWDKKEFYFVIGGKQFVCEPDSCEVSKSHVLGVN